MNNYKTEIINDKFYLRIFKTKKNGCSIYFIGLLSLFMFFTPILIILFVGKGVTLGAFIVSLIGWFISIYFARLYLWNKFGEEVLIISKNSIERYYSYKFFNDNRSFHYFKKMQIVFFIEGSIAYVDRIDSKYFENSIQSSVIGFDLDRKIITSHNDLLISEIITIRKKIIRWGNTVI